MNPNKQRREAEQALAERDRLGLTSGVAVKTENGQVAGFAFTKEDIVTVQEGIAAAEAMQAEKQSPQPEKDPRGPRISCARLQFRGNVTLHWGIFESSLEARHDPRQRRIIIDYLPRVRQFEVQFIPAPGQKEEPVTEVLPGDWASYRPR